MDGTRPLIVSLLHSHSASRTPRHSACHRNSEVRLAVPHRTLTRRAVAPVSVVAPLSGARGRAGGGTAAGPWSGKRWAGLS